ncbi:MAG: DNA polymerase III subunit delta [Ilumatobacteraceae bacterium]|nr:DNA polymerase III subunit delta [Ilumatobacteraceae bacterium]
MGVFLISGDESLISQELSTLVNQLVGEDDRMLIVEEFDASDSGLSIAAVADALGTLSMFSDRRIVVVRNVQQLDASSLAIFAQGLLSKVDSSEVVITTTGRVLKVLDDVLKELGVTKVGASAGGSARERQNWVESHLVQAGVNCAPDAVRLILNWFGNDASRLAGLIGTLNSAYGVGTKLSRDDVEVFLGQAGAVPLWDLTDAIDAGNTALALTTLHRFLGPDTHPLQVLSMLANRYSQMMRFDAHEIRSAADAAQLLGIKDYPAQKLLEQFRILGGDGVAQALSLLAAADIDLRGAKDWEPELVMEVLIARLSRLGGSRYKEKKTVSRRR